MKKKLLSIALCLCMALTLLPTAAMASGDTYVIVNGVRLDSSTPYWKNGESMPTNQEADYNAYFNSETVTLTLRDAEISGANFSAEADSANYGIRTPNPLDIKLVGTNTVTANAATGSSIGIYLSGGNLTISGSGSLTVSGGTSADGISAGIYVRGELTVNGGSITAIGETAVKGDSYGIKSGPSDTLDSTNGPITIIGGTVTAIGGAGKNSYGIHSSSVAISGSAYVTAAGGTAKDSLGESTGVDGLGGTFTIGDNATLIAVGGTATAGGGKSRGIRNSGYNTVVSGNAKLVAIGGTGYSGNTESVEGGCSYGVEGLTYNGGLVVAKSGKATTSSAMCGAADGSGTNSVLVGANDNTSKYVVFGDRDTYHVYAENIDSSDTDKVGITWSGNNLTLDNTIIIGADSEQSNSVALHMAKSGTLALKNFNVILSGNGNYATYALGSDDSLTIEGTGSLVAVGGNGGTGGNACGSISVMGAMTQNGGSLTTVGGYWNGGSAFGIGVAGAVTVSGGSGVAVCGYGSNGVGTAFLNAINSSPVTPTGATLLGGAWGGRAAVWGASERSATPAVANATVAKASADAATVDFTLTNYTSASDNPWKLYDAETGGSEVPGVTATQIDRTLTLNHASNIPTGDYYLAITESGKAESARLKLTVSAYVEPTAITAAAIAGVTAPVAGATPVTAIIECAQYTGTVSWSDSPATFAAKTVYTATITLTPKTGYTLTGVAENFFTVAGATSISNNANSGTITAVFPATGEIPNPSPSTGSSSTLVTEIKSAGSVTGSNLDKLVSKNKELTVTGGDGAKLVLSTDALKGINEQTSGSVKVEIEDVSGAHQDAHAGKAVFSLTVTSGGKTVSDFGGSVTASLPYALKDGEKAEDVAVWYLAPDETMTELPCTYDAKAKLATFTVTHFSEYVVGVKDWVNPFSDVKEADWFYDDVAFVHAAGMMSGTGGAAFGPHGATTRAMIVTILYRMAGSPSMEDEILGYPFADVDAAAYYGTAVYWARLNHIADGYDSEHFGPNDTVTREQLAAILYRYAQHKGYDVTAGAELSKFADEASISGYAKTALSWANANELISGKGGGILDPRGSAERCQVAAILHQFCENIVK